VAVAVREALVLVSRRSTATFFAAVCALLLVPGGSFGGAGAPTGPSRSLSAGAYDIEAKLVADSPTARSTFGDAVALSANGDVALIGQSRAGKGKGAAWIFTRRGSSWSSIKLTGRGGQFGESVALSATGRIALIGAPGDSGNKGAAWLFRSRGGGTWVGAKLTGKDQRAKAKFGSSVALSADGSVALVGGFREKIGGSDDKGAAWVFARSGSTWTQQGGKLTAGREESWFGCSVALSADGRTALIGGFGDSNQKGAAWVFTRPFSKWVAQGGKLTGTDRTGKAFFGGSVALSADGNTALVGGENDNGGRGAAWVFRRSGSTWAQQGPRLTGGGEVGKGDFGSSVALSADGDTALVGGSHDARSNGAAWVFTRSESEWSQHGRKLTGPPKSWFGWSVALSADSHTALVGAPTFADSRGMGVVFFNPAQVGAIRPIRGSTEGGTPVTIEGSGFTRARSVVFGTTPAFGFRIESPTEILAVAPRGQGTVTVKVRNSRGTSPVGTFDRFTYVDRPTITALNPSSGASSGGTPVEISGTDFIGATEVRFGTREAEFKVDSATRIQAFAPPGQGIVDVTVLAPGGLSTSSAASRFTYFQAVAFDNLVTGGPGSAPAALTRVAGQYAPQGVTFNNLFAIDYAKAPGALPGFARSGSVAVEQCVGVEFCSTPMRATFSAPQRMVRVWVGFSFPLNKSEVVELTAKNAAGTVVATASASLPANPSPTPIRIPIEIRLGTATITEVEVALRMGYTSGLAVDDVTFEP